MSSNTHPFIFEHIGLGIWRGVPPLMDKLHSHTAVEFNLVVRGGLTYRFAGELVKLRAGTLYVFGGITPHEIEQVEQDTDFVCLTVPLATFIGWRLPQNISAPVLRGEILCDPSDRDEKGFAYWEEDLQSSDPRRARATLLELHARLERMAMSPALSIAWQRAAHRLDDATIGRLMRVEQMLQTIATKFAEPLQLADLAAPTGWHPHYASEQFRRAIGVPPGEFLIRQRVSHAQYLLALGEEKVMTVAEECGFASQSSFYTAFMRLTGTTPAAYRKSAVGKANY